MDLKHCQIDSNANMEKLVDVVIIGDGPAGAAAGIMMAKSGLSVCISGLPSHNKLCLAKLFLHISKNY